MEEHGHGSATAMEKPSFMKIGFKLQHMSDDQKEERKIYYIHVLEHPNLYNSVQTSSAQRAETKAGNWMCLHLGPVKWNWLDCSQSL